MKGYLYPQSDGVYVNPKLKPDTKRDKFWENVGFSDMWLNDSKYRKALKEWESQLVKVENAHIAYSGRWYLVLEDASSPVLFGNEFCEYEGKQVIKLL